MIESDDGGKPYMKEKNESKEKNKTRNEDKNEGKIIRVLEIYTRLLNGAVINKEEEAERWIRTSPVSFCDTHDKKVISQILNNYDQETTDFYLWKVRYSQAELSELIRQNTKSDYGDIIDLIPIQRGKSGRICKLKIVGSFKTLTIGKELEIRRTLSSSHLFSSAFVVDKGELKNGVPEWFLLTGAGWGHGVGLCQIGAAVMGERGYTYDEILLHYYKGADIRRFY